MVNRWPYRYNDFFVSTRITIPSFTVFMTIVLNSNRPVYWSITLIQASELLNKNVAAYIAIQLRISCYTSIEVNDDLLLLQKVTYVQQT